MGSPGDDGLRAASLHASVASRRCEGAPNRQSAYLDRAPTKTETGAAHLREAEMRRQVSVILVAVVRLALTFAVPAEAVEPEQPAPTTAGEVAQSEPSAGSPGREPTSSRGTHGSSCWSEARSRVPPRQASPRRPAAAWARSIPTPSRGFQFKGSAKAAAALRKNPNVLSVTPDHAVYVAETDPFGIERIDAFIVGGGDAYSAGYRGAGARIAVIDTGIDLDHPDLAESIDTDAGLNCFDDEVPPNDGHGHGTHVAGTAAAPLNDIGVVGVAPEATLVPIKVFDDAGNSSEALVLCGVDRSSPSIPTPSQPTTSMSPT